MSTVQLQRVDRIAGIREDLPRGERVLWQGRPSWRSHVRHAFHIREIAGYFVLLAVVATAMDAMDGRPLTGGIMPAVLGVLACLLISFLAWLSCRTTVYAITTRRVFLRVGIALPLTVNLPLHRILSAGLAVHGDRCGDVPLLLEEGPHLAYLHLWPHARPWHLKRPEPMLRSVAEPAEVAQILAGALQAAHALATAKRSEMGQALGESLGVSVGGTPEAANPGFEAAA